MLHPQMRMKRLELDQESSYILYGRLLMSISKGLLGNASPTVATVTVFARAPALDESHDDGYGAFRDLKSKCDVTKRPRC